MSPNYGDKSMMTRRAFLTLSAFGLMSTSSFALASGRRVVEYTLPIHATPTEKIRIAFLSDPHVVDPWFSLQDWADTIAETNALSPDLILLGGDYSGYNLPGRTIVSMDAVAREAARLRAPLGVFAALGNHDWSANQVLGGTWKETLAVERALLNHGIGLKRNASVKLTHKDRPFWLAITDSYSYDPQAVPVLNAPADLDKTLAPTLNDDNPVILLAHEPDIFAHHHPRVALQVSGHMHAGQVNVLGWSPAPLPSRYGDRYLHGLIQEAGKTLIVSGGLGYSRMPVRFGAPPEITLITALI